MRLFLYGTLMNPRALARFGGRPLTTKLLPARLPGFRRVQLRGTGYPTIRRAPRHTVHGVVVHVTADTLRRLIAYEADRYRQIQVQVQTNTGPRKATCFYGDAPLKTEWRTNT